MEVKDYKVYRSDIISSVDGFLPVKDVLKLEMFGDEGDIGLRNFEGVLSNLKEIYPELDFEPLLSNFDEDRLESDDEYRFLFTNELVKYLESKLKIPGEYFNYAIWACDDPENVVDTYGVELEDVNLYEIKGVLLQDLGYEGQLYGVAEYPEAKFEESCKTGGNIMNEEDFQRIYEVCCASGASNIANLTPQNMLGVVDAKAGLISDGSPAKKANGGKFARGANTDYCFSNETMKVHKKRGKKGDAITGTGIVYANGRILEAMDKILAKYDESGLSVYDELESVIRDIYLNSDNADARATVEDIYDTERACLKPNKLSIEKLDAVAETCLDRGAEEEAERIWDAIAIIRQKLTESKEPMKECGDGYKCCCGCHTDLLDDEVVEIGGKPFCPDCSIKEYDKEDEALEE